MGAIITFGNFTAPAGTWLEAERGRQDRRVLRPILIFGFPLSTRACVSWGSSPTSLLGLGIRRLLRRDFRIRETHCCIECLFLVWRFFSAQQVLIGAGVARMIKRSLN